jgi:hypothetical protein
MPYLKIAVIEESVVSMKFVMEFMPIVPVTVARHTTARFHVI